jgi:hypothetical protein
MNPPYYYFGTLDSESADGSYDLTRECFHIDGLSCQIRKQKRLLEGRMRHHLTPRSLVRGTKPNFLKQTRERNSCKFKNCRPSSTRNESACTYFS